MAGARKIRLESAVLYALAALLIGCIAGIFFERYIGKGCPVPDENPATAPPPPELSVEGRVEADLAQIPQEGLMVALAFGQSNAANHGETHSSIVNDNVFNFYNRKLYVAADPLLGATGRWGSVWTRLGDRLVQSGHYRNIIFVPIAVGSSSIAQWAPGGDLHTRLTDAIAQVHASGLTFTHLLWHQGETDAFVLHTGAEEYRKHFTDLAASIRKAGVKAPLYVSIATRGGRARQNTEIARVQRDLVDNRDILAGPNTDELGFAYRFDGIHFSTEGLEKAAQLWLECLK